MKITIVGTGYVGLVSAVCLANAGHQVCCIDIDAAKVKQLKSGRVTIHEPGLEEIFRKNLKLGRLSFSRDFEASSVGDSRFVVLALPTPATSIGSAYVEDILLTVRSFAPYLTSYTILVNKSTVPVGTTERVMREVRSKAKAEVDVISNPEFLREGKAVEDFMNPTRIVIGTNTDRVKEYVSLLYESFSGPENPILYMDIRSAELCKYACNAFLATKICFINEMANLSDRLGADIDMIRMVMERDPRIGGKSLHPGIGYGGSCLPKDVSALLHKADALGYPLRALEAVKETNDRQPLRVLEALKSHFGGFGKGRQVAVWGLAFKPCTDDIREAASTRIIRLLLDMDAKVKVHDPEAMANTRKVFGDEIDYGKDRA